MKNYKSKILIGIGFISLVAATVSCRKSEKFPVDKVSGIYVFDPRDSAGTTALKYLLNVYSVMEIGYNRVGGDFLDAASDDAVSSVPGGQVTVLATAGYTALDLPANENVWSSTNSTNTANYWNGIRSATEFMNGIDVVPVKDFVASNGKINGIGVSTRYIWRNEARLLRAYFYFELVKRFGGVPLLGDKVYNVNDNIALPRNTFADCISYIVSECDKAKDSLITVPLINPGQDNYRMTKGAAMALKAKVLLYAASPAFNNPSGNSNALVGYPTYSADRWKAAATAASQVMAIGNYSLDPNFKNIFLTQNDPEDIMVRTANNSNPGNGVESNNAPVGYSSALGQGRTSPTQELVDSYPMSNGLPITDPASNYDPNNPYNNRDPRFYATILYNGAPWLGTSLQTFEGGVSKPNNGQTETLTSYYMCKFMAPQTGTSFQTHDETWVIIRYAEVKLDFAEARNETDGPTDSVYQQLRDLRNRAGIAPGDGNYGLASGMTKDQMRTAIQNERRIEMAFEEQRYFDIRRWGIASTVMNQPLMGMSITNSNGNLTYNPIVVLQPKFVAPKMNVYPIPYDEVLKNPAIGQAHQNPGWSF